jgi:ribosomal protein S18 acetylase RimI-like enzyme
MITYQNTIQNITEEMLNGGFFAGWPNHPSPEKHLKILTNSDYVVLAVEDNKKVIGFINAISDKVLSSYIPLLEVLPEYHILGIGKELLTRMLEILKNFYMVDLCCDEYLSEAYSQFGMIKVCGMVKRNYDKQKGI